MYVGNPRKPVKSECDACRDAREAREEEEEEEEESGGKGRGVSEDGKARMKEKGKEIGKNRKENAKGRRGKNDGDVQQGSASEDA
jgi:hypothetical protein